MDLLLSSEVLVGVLVGFAVLAVGLVLLQMWNSFQIRKMSATAYQRGVHQARVDAAEIVAEAKVEAESVLGEANIATLKAMAEAGKNAQKVNESYQNALQKLIEQYQHELEKNLNQGQEAFSTLTDAVADGYGRRQKALDTQVDGILQSLAKVSETLTGETSSAIATLESSIAGVTETLKDTLEKEDAAVRKRLEDHFSQILNSAEADVAEYRKARLTLLDSHIERLVEDIAVRVLHKKLSLDEHAELALQALADAKAHNVL